MSTSRTNSSKATTLEAQFYGCNVHKSNMSNQGVSSPTSMAPEVMALRHTRALILLIHEQLNWDKVHYAFQKQHIYPLLRFGHDCDELHLFVGATLSFTSCCRVLYDFYVNISSKNTFWNSLVLWSRFPVTLVCCITMVWVHVVKLHLSEWHLQYTDIIPCVDSSSWFLYLYHC